MQEEKSIPALNHRQSTFVAEYLLSGNATLAAKKAGYSEGTAYSQGQRLLKNVVIMEALSTHQSNVMEEAEVTLAELVKEVRQISRAGRNDYIRLKAYDMLFEYLGAYDKHRIDHAAIDTNKVWKCYFGETLSFPEEK